METANYEYAPKGIAKVLNKYFGFAEKGSTMKREVAAGISVFLLSVCVLLVNTRVIASSLGADRAAYCGIYLAAALTSFIGTILIGLVARLPLVQVSSLSLSTSFISLIGASNGLTYQNLLAVSFISAILYTVIMVVPATRDFVMKALPSAVKRALPVAMGLYIVFYALNSIGLVSLSSGSVTYTGVSGLSAENLMSGLGAIAAIIAVVAGIIFTKMKKHVSTPVFFATITGFIAFYVIGLWYCFSQVYSVNRAYLAAGAENMYNISLAFEGLELGTVFTKGFDFSAYTGNVFQLFLSGALTFFFMSMYESQANVQAVYLLGEMEEDQKKTGLALACNGVTNIVASILGSAPVTVGKQSAAAAKDGGKSGLTSLVASVGFLISLFTWALFALLATYTATVSDYGHATSNSFAEYAQAVFAVTDGVMIVVGLLMIKGIGGVDATKFEELLPFAATVVGFVFTSNIVIGVCAGLAVYILGKLFSFKKEEIAEIGISTVVVTAVLILTLAL